MKNPPATGDFLYVILGWKVKFKTPAGTVSMWKCYWQRVVNSLELEFF